MQVMSAKDERKRRENLGQMNEMNINSTVLLDFRKRAIFSVQDHKLEFTVGGSSSQTSNNAVNLHRIDSSWLYNFQATFLSPIVCAIQLIIKQ